MIENYDPNYSYGTHTIEVTIQKWQYRKVFTNKVKGNCKGVSLLSHFDDIFGELYEHGAILTADSGKTLECEPGDDDWGGDLSSRRRS